MMLTVTNTLYRYSYPRSQLFGARDDAKGIFLVKIAKNEPVNALRKAIEWEKSHGLEHVDADTLILYDVSTLDDIIA